jgi:Family of unknown function (DUF5681)
MANNRQTSTREVGYAKPPLDTQFKKGISDNPSGRPKGSVSLSTVVQRAFKRTSVHQRERQTQGHYQD